MAPRAPSAGVVANGRLWCPVKPPVLLGLGWLMQNAMYFQGEAFLRERGNEAMRLTPPIKTALNMGLTVGGGTDAHRVMSYNPFVSLQWMLERGLDEGVNLTALAAIERGRPGCGWPPRPCSTLSVLRR